MAHQHLRNSLLLTAAVTAIPALAADGLGVKTGLWETTTTSTTSGMALPPATLEKMPPERRAQMEAMMKQMGGTAHTMKGKSCVTEKDLKEGAFRQQQEDNGRSCKYTPVVNTPRRQEWIMHCANSASVSEGHMVIEAIDASHIQGQIDMKMPRMTINIKLASQWLGSSCAGADKD